MNFDMLGPALVLGLPLIGSSIGCAIAGMASHAVMSRVEEGHGKFIGMAAAPSSQSIYGFVLMLLLRNAILDNNFSPLSAIGIAVAAGSGMMVSAIFQGKLCASGIQASAKQPSVYGKCWAAIGIVESFALFALVFSLMLL